MTAGTLLLDAAAKAGCYGLMVRTSGPQIRGGEAAQGILLVFFGFCIGWVSTTIARYVYPPPKRWGSNRRHE